MVAQDLYGLACRRLDAGELPRQEPRLLLAANGCGAHCALCAAPITPREIEYEIEYEIELAASSCLRFHIRCHDAWDAAMQHCPRTPDPF